MKICKLAVLTAAAALFASAPAFADDYNAPDQSGGNGTAHVPYNPGTDPAPVETHTVLLPTWPVQVPVQVPVSVEQPEIPEHAPENEAPEVQ